MSFKPIQLKTIEDAPEASKPILESVDKKFGFTPNLMKAFANNAETLKAYLQLSEHLSNSGLTPLEQQVVAITVSRENQCGYCVAAHSAISMMNKLDENVINQLRNGEPLNDGKLEALRAMTKRLVSSKGWIDSSDAKEFYDKGYNSQHLLAIIIGVSMKTLSNYVNHIAQTPLDSQFEPYKWSR